MLPEILSSGSIFASINYVWLNLVNLTTKQVEILFGELEYIEPRLSIRRLGLRCRIMQFWVLTGERGYKA